MVSETQWRRCSACKKPIPLGSTYWVCSVSTCNKKRTGLAFCTVGCYEVHLPVANHRDSWAEEKTAPMRAEAIPAPARASGAPRRRIVRSEAPEAPPEPPREVLVVVSRLKEYIRAKSGFNTSEGVLQPLSEIVRAACDEAIDQARAEGRTTVLERDFPEE